MVKVIGLSKSAKTLLLTLFAAFGAMVACMGVFTATELLAQSDKTVSVKPLCPQFEVASIRPAAPPSRSNPHIGIRLNPGRVDIGYWSILQLIVKAYRIQAYQLIGPGWMGSARFDIQARLPEGSNQNQVPEMLQRLLAERFGLVLHTETRDLKGFELTVDKGGPKMQAAPPEPDASLEATAKEEEANTLDLLWGGGKPFGLKDMNRSPNGDLHMEFERLPILALVQILSSNLRAPVIDRTSLKGRYHVTLDYNPMGALPANVDSVGDLLMAAKRLGLRLEPKAVPCSVLVVDQVERVPTAN